MGEFINNILSFFDQVINWITDAWIVALPVFEFLNDWLFLFIGSCVLICCYLGFKSKINSVSKKEFDKNINNTKYIDDLYVELGNSHEMLRYFLNKKKWYKRLKNDFYLLFNNHFGKLLSKKENLPLNEKIKNKDFGGVLLKTHESITESRKGKFKLNDNIGSYLSLNAYSYYNELEDMTTINNLLNKKVCFLIGEAGSGKTNLMTRFANIIIKGYKKHCIYINAKMVMDGDIEKKFNEYFYTQYFINEHNHEKIRLYLTLLSKLKIQMFIIIEAINENEDPDFMLKIIEFIEKFSKYKNINFIVTTRSEFFEIKYKKDLDEQLTIPSEIIRINNNRFNETSLDRMLEKYKKYFNFYGAISTNVEMMIKKSPIIMRMFFECYKDSNETINNLTKFKLFNHYIQKIKNDYPSVKVWNLLYEIAEKMIENEKYDYVKCNELVNIEQISNTLVYENVLLDKSIVENENEITEQIENIISFTYDEMRDFIITKYLLKKYPKQDKPILEFLDKMKKDNSSVLEGTIRYFYGYYKESKNNNMSKKILNAYANDRYIFTHKSKTEFQDLGLEIIFQQYGEIEDFELEYILSNHFVEQDIFNIIACLIRNTKNTQKPNIEIFNNEVLKLQKDSNHKSNLLSLNQEVYEFLLSVVKEQNINKNILFIDFINLTKWLLGEGGDFSDEEKY